MEEHLQNNPKQGYPVCGEDEKCVLGIGTTLTLVATIEEAKDRISQIEHIFCNQIFPIFQLKSASLQNFFSESKKAREDACKEKENDLILQIERLQCEKQQALEENSAFKLEMEKASKEQEEKTYKLLAKVKCQQLEIDEIGLKLKKSKEIDEGMELRNRIDQLVREKDFAIVNKGKQLIEYEEKQKRFLPK